jgi:hypothetical protein
VTPVGPPTQPSNLSYTALDSAVSVKFTTPDNTGGFSIANYEYSTNNWNRFIKGDKVSVNNEMLTHFTPQAISRQGNDFLKTENKNLIFVFYT